ncbi:hypothetical protein PoB_000533600 [Plakobranchus ocellatus]|uniref:Uncharacterized protein n=1 Tax=Plakobranchus ocellatus TaxID=259542 RepID=A0AAV3XV06_9GAST|nr:hypothetical protein PoB_000533600 [Plakobranchus ocellatus]
MFIMFTDGSLDGGWGISQLVFNLQEHSFARSIMLRLSSPTRSKKFGISMTKFMSLPSTSPSSPAKNALFPGLPNTSSRMPESQNYFPAHRFPTTLGLAQRESPILFPPGLPLLRPNLTVFCDL